MTDVNELFKQVNDRTDQSRSSDQRAFALGRYEAGAFTRDYLLEKYFPSSDPGTLRVLDVGCGNGGVLFPFAERGLWCVGMDRVIHPEIEMVASRARLPVSQVLGTGEHLPFNEGTFDLVLYVETAEHVRHPLEVGREISRVMKPKGLCFITTPARLRFMLGRDPHYGIRGLLLLPDPLQRVMFRLLRPGETYEVEHIFWTVWGVMRTLPGLELCEVTSSLTAGATRRLLWDWIVARKK